MVDNEGKKIQRRHTEMGQFKKIVLFLLVMAVSVSLSIVGCTPASTPAPGPTPTLTPTPTPTPAPTPAPAQAEFKWRFQCPYADSDIDYSIVAKGVAALIEKASDGRIKVDTYSAGALVAPDEVLSAVIDGSIEMGMNMTGAQGEVIPADYCTGLIGSAETLGEMYDLTYRTGLFEIVQKDFRSVVFNL